MTRMYPTTTTLASFDTNYIIFRKYLFRFLYKKSVKENIESPTIFYLSK
jgi:hypothetical protein